MLNLRLTTNLEIGFQKMAESAARDLVQKSNILGLGSGSAVAHFAAALGERVRRESLDVTIVPSSMQSWLLSRTYGLTLAQDSGHCPPKIDLAVDGADQISLETRSMIKGGGGALMKEKIIISSARKCFILADESKYVEHLGRSVPVEVAPFSLLTVEQKIRDALAAEPVLRKLEKGYPFFTESGNLILDCQFRTISDPSDCEKKLKTIPGVVEAGLFNNEVEKFYKVNQDGTFNTL